jgi:serine/threonine protein kinase
MDDPLSAAALERELLSLSESFHPLISCLYEVIDAGEFVYLALEWPTNGSLRDILTNKGPMTEAQARLLLVQLLSALEYLHYDRHIIFRNLRPENIRLDENHNMRLGDFSFSDIFSPFVDPRDPDSLSSAREDDLAALTDVAYTAPEVLMEQPTTTAMDIWSLGVLLFELVTASLPFQTLHSGRLAQKILREDPPFPRTLSPFFCDLIRRMLTKDPHQRITLENIKQHPWVNDGMCYSLAVNFNDMEGLRTGFDPLGGAIDPDILESVRSLGLDVSRLPSDLLNGAMSEAASAYRQFVRAEISRRLVDIVPGLLLRPPRSNHRNSMPAHDSLPRFAPNNGLMWIPPRSVASTGGRKHPDVRGSARSPVPMLVGCALDRRMYCTALSLPLCNG